MLESAPIKIEGEYAVWDGSQWCGLEVLPYGGEYELRYGFNRALGDLLKSHLGASWSPTTKKWTVTRNARVAYGLDFLSNGPCRQRYYTQSAPIYESPLPLRAHQLELYRDTLWKGGVLGAHEMGLGKTLTALSVMHFLWDGMKDFERRVFDWHAWVILPTHLQNTWENEIRKWGIPFTPKFITNSPQAIKKSIDSALLMPRILIIDEIAEFRRPSQRTTLTSDLSNRMFLAHGLNGAIVLGLSGQPAPKDYSDWYYPVEICRPGFLKESRFWNFDRRLSVYETMIAEDGKSYPKRICWRDATCAICGVSRNNHNSPDCPTYYQKGLCANCNKQHFSPGCGELSIKEAEVDEISLLSKRLAPLVVVKAIKDCVDLPDLLDYVVEVEPTDRLVEIAELTIETCVTTIEVISKLHQLSDGFVYINKEPTLMDSTPKLDAFSRYIDESQDDKVIIFSSYTSSIDLVCDVMQRKGFTVIRVDGGGIRPVTSTKTRFKDLESYFNRDLGNSGERIAVIGHPLSLSMGYNLQTAKLLIFYSNGNRSDHRTQGIARAWRSGATKVPVKVVDFVCLGPDKVTLEALKNKRDVETLTLKEIRSSLNDRRSRLGSVG